MTDISSIDKQVELVATVVHRAKMMMLAQIYYNLPAIVDHMFERISTIGYDDYDIASFLKSIEQLDIEAMDEFSDALFYYCVKVLKLDGMEFS